MWILVLTIVFGPGNEQQLKFEFPSAISCGMARRALEDKVLIGGKGLPPVKLEYGLSECKVQ